MARPKQQRLGSAEFPFKDGISVGPASPPPVLLFVHPPISIVL
jgi:hypothetical protein